MDAETVGDVVERHARRDGQRDRRRGDARPIPIPSNGTSSCSRSGSTTCSASTPPFDEWVKEEAVEPEMFVERIQALADAQIAEKIARHPARGLDPGRKEILLQSLDHHWKEHLAMLDALRQVVHLRAYAQKKPIDEYKHEAFAMFERMLGAIREDVTGPLARARFSMQPDDLPELPDFVTTPYRSVHRRRRHVRHRRRHRRDPLAPAAAADAAARACPASGGTVAAPASRNAPCPCGSGRKYKHCHGAMV